MVMYEVELIIYNVSYKIYVDPCFDFYVKMTKHDSRTIWRKGKPASANINGEKVNLVDIPSTVLDELNKREKYSKVTQISFEYVSNTPVCVWVDSRYYGGGGGGGSTRGDVWGYNMSEWYKNLDDKYQQLKEKNKQLEQELLHEKYNPGGSGYNEAKRDFEQLGGIDVKVSNKKRK